MKPYVICHMMTSVDGRILTENWGKQKGLQTYEPTGNSFRANAWICGRTTMERDFASKRALKLKPANSVLPKEDHVVANGAKSFAIAVDRSGKLNWQKGDIDGDHLVVVLSEQVSQAYLAFLQAGLIDELSILQLPIADCNPGSPTVFESGASGGKIPVSKLKLLRTKKLENDVLWFRYKVL
jgi:riboflavin biosynthesis pyrimidine reductase